MEVSVAAQTLKFLFPDGSNVEGTPWDLLNKDESLPNNAFAAAFVHKSAAAIWDRMTVNFNGRLSAGKLVLLARPDDFRAEFATISSDQWKFYRVTDWERGTAVTPDGRFLLSVHAKSLDSPRMTSSGRKPTYDQDQINAVVLKQVQKRGFPKRGGDDDWRSLADVGRLIGAFCFTTKGQEPANSTLQGYVREALSAAKRSLNTDN